MSIAEAKQVWRKTFYDDDYNIALRAFKRLCLWVSLNVPDASMIFGLPRYALNFVTIMLTAGIVGWVIFAARNPIEIILGIYAASWVPGIVYMRTVAAAVYWGIEKYQGTMRRLLEKDVTAEQACTDLFEAQ